MDNPQIQEEFQVVLKPGGITHPVLGAFAETGSIPKPVVKTGTIETDNAGATAGVKVLGDGTLFTSELEEGGFLADADGVVRRIKFILSDTMLELNAKFPTSLSAEDVNYIPKNKYKKIFAQSTGTVAATLQEQDFALNATFETPLDGGQGAQPISYDVSTADTQITVQISQ